MSVINNQFYVHCNHISSFFIIFIGVVIWLTSFIVQRYFDISFMYIFRWYTYMTHIVCIVLRHAVQKKKLTIVLYTMFIGVQFLHCNGCLPNTFTIILCKTYVSFLASTFLFLNPTVSMQILILFLQSHFMTAKSYILTLLILLIIRFCFYCNHFIS